MRTALIESHFNHRSATGDTGKRQPLKLSGPGKQGFAGPEL